MPSARQRTKRDETWGLTLREIYAFEHEALNENTVAVEIVPLPCMHYGHPAHVATLFDWAVEYISASQFRFGLFMGDMMENATIGSKGNPYECKEGPQEQIDYLIARFQPIADKIIGVIRGNHENRTRRAVGIDPGRVIAQALDVHYFGIEGIIKLKFGRNTWDGNPLVYLIYAHHGYGGGRTMGSKANILDRMPHRVEGCDVYMMAHTHQMMAWPDGVYTPIPPRYRYVGLSSRLMVMCGSFMEGAEYAAEKGYKPTVPGTVVVTLSGKNKAAMATIKAGWGLTPIITPVATAK